MTTYRQPCVPPCIARIPPAAGAPPSPPRASSRRVRACCRPWSKRSPARMETFVGAAAKVMVDMGHRHGEVLPVLMGLVRTSESPGVRRMATFTLRELAPDRPEAAEVLLDAAGDTDLGVRRAAFTAMASLIEPPPQVAECLAQYIARR